MGIKYRYIKWGGVITPMSWCLILYSDVVFCGFTNIRELEWFKQDN